MTEPVINPYAAPDPGKTPVSPYRRLSRLLLVIVGLVLLYRGLFSVYSFTHVYILQGFPNSSFYHALMTKDAIYGLTAVGGSMVIFFPSRTAWFSAIAHWIWYVAADVIVVLFETQFPRIFFGTWPGAVQLTLACALAVFGLVVLLWRPVMDRCGVTIRRSHWFAALFSGELILGLLLSWLALSRLW